MKKASLILIALLGFLLVFSGCKKEPFPYPMEHLWGYWKATHMTDSKGKMKEFIDFYFLPKTTFTFQKNGVFLKEGLYGNGKGTYKIEGKIIKSYDGNIEDLKIEVLSMSSKICMVKVTSPVDGETRKFQFAKQ